jgi:hypothetical protein
MYWHTHCPRIYRGYTTGPLKWPDMLIVPRTFFPVRGGCPTVCVGRASFQVVRGLLIYITIATPWIAWSRSSLVVAQVSYANE